MTRYPLTLHSVHVVLVTSPQRVCIEWQVHAYAIKGAPVFLGFFPPPFLAFSFLFLKFASKSFFALVSFYSHLSLTMVPPHWHVRQSKSSTYIDREKRKKDGMRSMLLTNIAVAVRPRHIIIRHLLLSRCLPYAALATSSTLTVPSTVLLVPHWQLALPPVMLMQQQQW